MKLFTVEHWLAAYDKVSLSENPNSSDYFLTLNFQVAGLQELVSALSLKSQKSWWCENIVDCTDCGGLFLVLCSCCYRGQTKSTPIRVELNLQLRESLAIKTS